MTGKQTRVVEKDSRAWIVGVGLAAALLLGLVGLRLVMRLHHIPAYLETRLRQNLNSLTLEGRPAPALEVGQYLGTKPPTLAALRGKPVLIYFWAHWCGSCRSEAPVLAGIKEKYAGQGLTLLAPTQLYGYVAHGEEAPPEKELAYLERVREQYYSALLDVPVPINARNFVTYGALATPTLVLVDRQGVVRLYRSSELTYQQLDAAVSRVVAQ